MIPFRDNAAHRRLSPVNTLLIFINIAVFGFELFLKQRGGDQIIANFALIPAHLTETRLPITGAALWPPVTLVTALFLHAGILHLFGNMLYLLIFGPAVEERLGHSRFLWFYLIAGAISGLAAALMDPGSTIPIIGASGAIAGVLGAYFVLFPRARLKTALPLIVAIRVIEVPALLYLIIWFGVQLCAGILAHPQGSIPGGVAWWAHVGGFMFGLALGPLLAKPQPTPRRARAR
ncbi:MAG: rhomboid family intramembrane serine protease [Candidatus Binataceae bacterium]